MEFSTEIGTLKYIDHALGGSRVTCDPAPTDTDEDHILLVENPKESLDILLDNGWTCSKGNYPGELFTSVRKGYLNIVLTSVKDYYDKFNLSTYVCRKLNLLDKKDRITVFQAILYGKEV